MKTSPLMRGASSIPLRVFAILSTLVGVGLIALMLYVGEPSKLWWWGMAIPFGAWITGPAIAPYIIARRYADSISLVVMLSFFLLSSAAASSIYFEAFFRSRSSTAALVFVFIPLYQWAVFLAVLGSIFVARKIVGNGE